MGFRVGRWARPILTIRYSLFEQIPIEPFLPHLLLRPVGPVGTIASPSTFAPAGEPATRHAKTNDHQAPGACTWPTGAFGVERLVRDVWSPKGAGEQEGPMAIPVLRLTECSLVVFMESWVQSIRTILINLHSEDTAAMVGTKGLKHSWEHLLPLHVLSMTGDKVFAIQMHP